MSESTIALVTGGSRGLGRSSVLHLADAGVDTVFSFRADEDAAAKVVAEVEERGARAVALPLDVGDSAQIPGFVDRVQQTLADQLEGRPIDYLVNNAGHGVYGSLAETTLAELEGLFAVHVSGPFLLTQALAPSIRDGGKVLFTSSGLTRFTLPGHGAYAAAKGAVEVLSRYFALELAPRRIAVNTVAPGAVQTDFGGGQVRDVAEVNEAVAQMTAMGRPGLPEDVGAAVAALLTGGTGWVTGQRIEISGGQRL